ncbi:conserved hypothetical protein [Talaromyces stipitatus ATCC 10500]|uniref:Phytanoyl-CoA dioxygenase family protein n=1 Tax=Talaromyces stipitatus (strain ATCC 10500 / CBS 375.48 / QM 6759 / NRRL 1006) TaxID=441959 RepID=B8MHH4_TALSN|nr:uncharacterized protein TSTA_022090 [Talaromyces stipitatus ATCC 10500]EED17153.1 conserved hypothetical protein [Talaromyces stipitatus ATCC 10500]
MYLISVISYLAASIYATTLGMSVGIAVHLPAVQGHIHSLFFLSYTYSLSDIIMTASALPSAHLPRVEVFDAGDAQVQEVVDALIKAGGCVIKNALSVQDVNAIEANVRPHIEADSPWSGKFFPAETRRVMAMPGKSKLYMEKIVFNKLYQAVCDKLLSSEYGCWVGDEWKQSCSKPQLNNTAVLSIGPGARDQELHRDSMIHHCRTRKMDPSEYVVGQETGIGFFVAGKKTTVANGATRFIPGSHLWDHSTPPKEDQCVYAELDPGDGFILLASAFHGGSANKTKDEERLVYSVFMTKGYLRQEENQYVANKFEDLKDMYDDAALETIGYGLSRPFLGWIDALPPLDWLRGSRELKDLF